MYGMYPDTWTNEQASRHRPTDQDQLRRRARKPHSVVPAVILARTDASEGGEHGDDSM